MKKKTIPELPVPAERVRLIKPMGKHLFRFLAFIICAAIFVAAFAASGIWTKYGTATETVFSGFFYRDRITESKEPSDSAKKKLSPDSDQSLPTRPDGSILVYGKTLVDPVYQTVGSTKIDWKIDASQAEPFVLIYCTYPRETYLSEASDYLLGTLGDLIYSDDSSRCATAVAKTVRETLEQNGIHAIFQYVESGGSLQGSHARAKELVSQTLEQYPSIGYVIDIGLDILTDSDGNCIRTVAAETEKPTAQVLAIVETDYENIAWQRDLAFAESLGEELNRKTPTIFRGVSFRTSSQNHSQNHIRTLTLKIGSCVNTIDEANRSANAVGKALSTILTN